uniref:NADH-ubiquinone oxidoreductase chain 4L n=1 Tax=Candida blackwelliae TaxID=497110 RepID=S5TP40_9ASCO|nr:NADH dehydrogenase subunit 4L [Candida blackwelliae]AGS44560.1 NADH dehydrogenase subunit 4L [Candida blackwelliae]
MIAIITTILTFYAGRNNTISLLMAIEILLLIVTVNIITIGGLYDDILGTIYAIVIILLAGAESAIGLSLLISFYRLRGRVTNIL